MWAVLDCYLGLIIFAVLAVTMSALTLNVTRDVALDPLQRAWLIAAMVSLAAASAWVIVRT